MTDNNDDDAVSSPLSQSADRQTILSDPPSYFASASAAAAAAAANAHAAPLSPLLSPSSGAPANENALLRTVHVPMAPVDPHHHNHDDDGSRGSDAAAPFDPAATESARSPAPQYETIFSYPSPAPIVTASLDFASYPPEAGQDNKTGKSGFLPASRGSKRIIIAAACVILLSTAVIVAGVLLSRKDGSDSSSPTTSPASFPTTSSGAPLSGSQTSNLRSTASTNASSPTTLLPVVRNNFLGQQPPVTVNDLQSSSTSSSTTQPASTTPLAVPTLFQIRNTVRNQCISGTSYAGCDGGAARGSQQVFMYNTTSGWWETSDEEACVSFFGGAFKLDNVCRLNYAYEALKWYGVYIRDDDGNCLQNDLTTAKGSSASACGSFTLTSVSG
ncbi:hypothetical protein DFJ73DRAFT_793263 [Zopfochytrium polystomum]|nr:hypothetical protein DFJ73DRAFT_793263 [Zopfochytrium polystomum]